MASQFTWDNEGITDGFMVFDNDTTSGQDFTQTDLDNGLTAACLTGNNKVGMGTDTYRCIGKVVAVSPQVDAAGIPVQVMVQVQGVVKMLYNTTAPTLNMGVVVDGAGKVKISPAVADTAAGGLPSRGTVIANDEPSGYTTVLFP
jgi:hypothetical protein